MVDKIPCAIRTFDGSFLTTDELAEFGMRIEPEPLPKKLKIVVKNERPKKCAKFSR